MTASNGESTKELTVVGLTIDTVDELNNTVSGQAPPGAWVEVDAGNEFGRAHRSVQAAALTDAVPGYWKADFSVPGPQGHEQETIDLAPGVGVSAQVFDDDGDSTLAGLELILIRFEAYPEYDVVYGWPNEFGLTLTIHDPSTGETFGPWFSQFTFELWQDGFDLRAGHVLTVSDGEITKVHTVNDQQITSIDAVLNRVTGTATPGTEISIGFDTIASNLNEVDLEQGVAFADASGNWSFQFVSDIVPGIAVDAAVGDDDHDVTMWIAYIPAPAIMVRPLEGLEGFGWPAGIPVTIEAGGFTVNPSPIPERLGALPWDTWFGVEFRDETTGKTWAVAPGQLVTASNGESTKELIVVGISIDTVDELADRVSGQAPPGAWVEVDARNEFAHAHRSVQAAALTDAVPGYWEADFSVPGPQGHEQETMDLAPGVGISAQVFDNDGDSTVAEIAPPNFVHGDTIVTQVYSVSGSTFTNATVTGETGWSTSFQSDEDGTGRVVEGVQLTLESTEVLEVVYAAPWSSSVELAIQGPPIYLWDIGSVPEGEVNEVGAAVRSPDPLAYPVTFTPGVDVTVSADTTTFVGPATQTLTVTVTPRGDVGPHGWFFVSVSAPDNPAVNAVITGATGGLGQFLFPDGHFVSLFGDEAIGVPTTFVVTIDVTPSAGAATFMPSVSVATFGDESNFEEFQGSSHQGQLYYGPDVIGTWTWSARGDYSWSWKERVIKLVTFPGYAPFMVVDPNSDIVAAADWPLGSMVTVSVDDDANSTNGVLYESGPALVGSADPGSDETTLAEVDLYGVLDIEPGHYVTVTDGVRTKVHLVRPVTITDLDELTNVLTGRATPFADAIVVAGDEAYRWVTADGDGV